MSNKMNFLSLSKTFIVTTNCFNILNFVNYSMDFTVVNDIHWWKRIVSED